MDMETKFMDNQKWKWIAFIFFITTCVFFILTISVWVIKDNEIKASIIPSCQDKTGSPIFRKLNWNELQGHPLSQLTKHETELVVEYLYSLTNLNLTRNPKKEIASSFIHTMELKPPKKTDVLRYLDHGGPDPIREARVFVYRGDAPTPVVLEMVVGPLPNISYAEVFNTTSRKTTIPYNVRAFVKLEFMDLYTSVAKVAKKTENILLESYNATFFKPRCGDQCLSFSLTPISSTFLEEGKRKSWFWFGYDLEFHTLYPLDFQFLVDMTSVYPDDWTVDKVFYSNQLFSSLDDFIDQYRCKPINKTRLDFPSKEERLFSTLEFREPVFPEENKRPPIQYEPDGTRIKIYKNTIKYMLWDFKFGVSSTVGLQFHDMRFSGERIVYELSMQEVIVTYSGNSPAGNVLNYADSAGLFGTRSRGLLPGVDCPQTAYFLDTFLYSENENGYRTYENAICVFEHNTNSPLRRHRAYGYSGAFYGGLVGSVLVVRTVVSIINYDYIYDTILYPSGAIEVKVSLTGYLATAYYTPEELKYGSHIHKHLMGGLHNHLFHFKVDMDVRGTQNKFETMDIKVEQFLCEWNNHTQSQTYIDHTIKYTEKEAVYDYNFSTPKYLLMSSANETTPEGVARSYRIKPVSMSKQLLPSGLGFSKSIPWADHQVVVTQHKDDEDKSTSIFTMWDAADPVVDFRSYYEDDDNIENEV